MDNKADYVEVEVACAEALRALDRSTLGKEWDDLSQSTREAIVRVRE